MPFLFSIKIFLQSCLLKVDEEGNYSHCIAQSSAWLWECYKFFWKAGNIFISLGKLKGIKRSSVFWNEIKLLMGIYRTSFVVWFSSKNVIIWKIRDHFVSWTLMKYTASVFYMNTKDTWEWEHRSYLIPNILYELAMKQRTNHYSGLQRQSMLLQFVLQMVPLFD